MAPLGNDEPHRDFGVRNEARVRYLDGEFEVLSPGDFVCCAVTGQPIALPDLHYWSVDAQEAYASAEISVQRYFELKAKKYKDEA